MSDYDDDELPPISVNISDADSSKFSIPDADTLASQRAEEAAREEQIRLLRAAAAAESQTRASHVARSDSSGSEGEAILSTLVSLRVATPAPAAVAPPGPAAVLSAIMTHIPGPPGEQDFLNQLLQMLEQARDGGTSKVFDSLMEHVCELLHGDNTWTDDEVIQVCVALICACVGEWRADANAALREMLDNVANPKQLDLLTSILASYLRPAYKPGGGGCGGEVGAGWARGAAGRGGDALAGRVAEVLLREMLGGDAGGADSVGAVQQKQSQLTGLVTSSWRSLEARSQHLAATLLGRVLRAAGAGVGAGEGGEVLALAAQLTAQASDRNHPDRLKVMVGISKLQLLFRPTR